MDGWIKAHRSLLDWEWHTDPNMVSLWMHLLVLANFEDKRWKGMVIKRGQLVTSISRLSETTGISQQSLRTCLAKLEQTQEINKQTTNKYTIITILKYDSYQQCDCSENITTNKQLTNNQQTTNKQLTTTKEYKEDKNNIIVDYANNAHARMREAFIVEAMVDLRVEQGCKSLGIDQARYKELVDAVINDWEFSNIPDNEWTMVHLLQTMRIKNNIKKREEKNGQQQTYIADPVARRNYERSQRLQAIAARAAALTAASGQSEDVPF